MSASFSAAFVTPSIVPPSQHSDESEAPGYLSNALPILERTRPEPADNLQLFNTRTSAPETNGELVYGEPRKKRPRAHKDLPSEPEVISLLSSDEEDSGPAERRTKRRHHPRDDNIMRVYYSGTTVPYLPGQIVETTESATTLSTTSDRADGGKEEDSKGWNTEPGQQTGANTPDPSLLTRGLFTPIASPEPQPRDPNGTCPEPPRVPLPAKELQLCPEQAELVDIIMSGRNVFYTGSAGCGKSTVLKAFTRRLQDQGLKVDIVAPTGISALGVGGSTTFVYAGWNLSSFKLPLDKLRGAAHRKFIRKRLRDTDVLVIDEISSK
ncbi:hypothetical protein F5Y10DRAFT_46233 [Nemania abortiva]|nr:hypothetical protein F5Y10DRAFT_46233 [Nemania abortiva]